MRNKKLLTLASLFCTATLCAGVGVATLGNDANTVVSAETPVYTKTVGGVEYTFEKDFNNLTYTELGDVLNKDLKSVKVSTVDGYTGAYHGNNAGNSYITSNTMLQLTDAAFTKDSGGIQFQFSSETAWKGGTRIELCYGDLSIAFTTKNPDGTKDNGRLDVSGTTFGKTGATDASSGIAWTGKNNGNNCSLRKTVYKNADDSLFYMYDGWATVKIYKNECIAIGGDETAATGYWLTFTVLEPGQETETVIHDGYLNNAMYTDTYDGVGLGNALGAGTLTVRNVEASLKIDKEAGLDVGDYSLKESAYSKLHDQTVWGGNDELYIKGVDREAVAYRNYTYALTTYFNTGISCGVEFRMKELSDLSSKLGSKFWYYLQVAVGSAQLDFFLDTTQTKLGIRMGYFESKMNYEGQVDNVLSYEVGAEYAVRVERVGVNPIEGTKDSVTDYIVRVYMAKVGTDGMVAEDWDATPVYEHFTTRKKCNGSISNNNISVHPSNNTLAHTMRISSNKYVGVKTNVNGVEKLNKVERGDDFAFADLITDENTICAGWSKGADTYSAEDYITADTVFENMTESKLDCTYRALTMTMEADKAASLRIRKRGENPHEISLNWAVTANDSNSLGEYFGGIKFGYKLTAKNTAGQTATYEEEVMNVTDGYTTPYAYSITQSNIDDYTLEFVCQAWVELNGVKYYTAQPDIDVDGRSVNDVATAVLNDVRETPVENEDGWNYVNAVDVDGVTKYTYLTAWQYNFIKNYIANA